MGAVGQAAPIPTRARGEAKWARWLVGACLVAGVSALAVSLGVARIDSSRFRSEERTAAIAELDAKLTSLRVEFHSHLRRLGLPRDTPEPRNLVFIGERLTALREEEIFVHRTPQRSARRLRVAGLALLATGVAGYAATRIRFGARQSDNITG